jgi:hypothetical protein
MEGPFAYGVPRLKSTGPSITTSRRLKLPRAMVIRSGVHVWLFLTLSQGRIACTTAACYTLLHVDLEEAGVVALSDTERALVAQLNTLAQRNEALAVELGILTRHATLR